MRPTVGAKLRQLRGASIRKQDRRRPQLPITWRMPQALIRANLKEAALRREEETPHRILLATSCNLHDLVLWQHIRLHNAPTCCIHYDGVIKEMDPPRRRIATFPIGAQLALHSPIAQLRKQVRSVPNNTRWLK